ncbi:MAG: hypothetical protein Q4A01_06440 [Coriobacteriales bacterium]|nr:hypothetical protein [Coriobacteriales bacterium]
MFALLVTATVLVGIPWRTALAQTHTYNIASNSPTVECRTAGDEYIISGTGSGGAVAISGGSEDNPVYVTLDGLTVENSSGDHENAPVQVENGYCILKLQNSNRLVGGWHDITARKDVGIAGLRVCKGATCVITSADGNGSTNGSLYAACSHDDRGGAGIGSNYNEDTGTIIIRGGTIEAHGGHCGAGIGSGRDGVCTNVTIEGGTIKAYGGEYAAGIGGGDHAGSGSGGNVDAITITGGTIEAYGGANGGAGIGGSEGGDTGTITIRGGSITARGCGRSGEKGDGCAAGIGGGDGGAATIVIDQDEGKTLSIDALGAWCDRTGGAGIGSANCTARSISIDLCGGTIVAQGGEKAAGIGGGNKQSGSISISGHGTVRATAGRDACAIGAGQQCHAGPITIVGSGDATGTYGYPLAVFAHHGSTSEGGQNAALIGSGDGTSGNIAISGAYVSLKVPGNSNLMGAGIGTGHSNDLSLKDGGIDTISASNSRIVFEGGTSMLYGAGIGAGHGSNVSHIALTNVRYDGPTIGSSSSTRITTSENDITSISIQGSTITATANERPEQPWAGIGTGPTGSVESISIENSNVTATGAHGGAGIGTAGLNFNQNFPLTDLLTSSGKCGSVSIASTDGTTHSVVATGSDGGAGIGGGVFTSVDDTITIRNMDVTARGGHQSSGGGAGIGGGSMCGCADITIEGSTVVATGGEGSAGIGSGGTADSSVLTDLVGTAWNTICGNVTIEDGSDVTATGGSGAAGIGLGEGAQQEAGTCLTIDGSTVETTGGDGGAGIGAGREGGLGRGAEARRIRVKGKSKVDAHGGVGAAGIGGGYEGGLEDCLVELAESYYSSATGEQTPGSYVKARGGVGAAGIGAGASSRASTSKGTLDGAHDASNIRIRGGFVAAYGGDASDSVPEGRTGPGAGIGGGSYVGDLEDCVITGGVVVAHAGAKHSGLSTAVDAQDIGHGGSRDGGGDGSDSIAIQGGTVLGTINQNKTVRISGGSVPYTFDKGSARNYSNQGDQPVYQTTFLVDTDSVTPITFAGETLYKLKDLSVSAPYYGCDQVFAREVSDDRAQVWLYLPTSAQNAATANFCMESHAQSVTGVRSYYGTTTEATTPDFNENVNVLKMASPLTLTPHVAGITPLNDVEFVLDVVDMSKALAGTLTFNATNGTIVTEKTQARLDATQPHVTVVPTQADEQLVVTATVEDASPTSDLYWGIEARYEAMVGIAPITVKILSDPSRTYNGQEIEDPQVKVTGAPADSVTFSYSGATLTQPRPIDPGTYTVTATATDGTRSAQDTRTFTISPYHASLLLTPQDCYYTGEPAPEPAYTISARETDTPDKSFGEGGGTVAFTYDMRSSNGGWIHVDKPIDVGFYRAKGKASGDLYYTNASATTYFSILEKPARRDPFLFVDMPETFVYDGHVVDDPLVWSSSDGDVSFAYYQGTEAAQDKRLAGTPADAGTYTVVVSVSQTNSFNAASVTKTFVIQPRPALLRIDAKQDERREGAMVQVELVGGLADVVGEEVALTIVKQGDVPAAAPVSSPLEQRDSLVATYAFAQVFPDTYELTATFTDPNYQVEPATQTYVKDVKPSYDVNAQDADKTFGDEPFSLEVTVRDAEGEPATPILSYELLGATDNAMLDNDVVLVDEQGTVQVLQAGIAAVRVMANEDATYHGDADCALVTVTRATLPLELSAHDKVYDGNPATATCTIDDSSFPVAYSQKDAVGLTYFRVLPQEQGLVTQSIDPDQDDEKSLPLLRLDGAPTDPGTYVVVATAAGDHNYDAAVKTARFSISVPEEPEEPEKPEEPDQPDTPQEPDTPESPDAPKTPETPVEPTTTSEPAAPANTATTEPPASPTAQGDPTSTSASTSPEATSASSTRVTPTPNTGDTSVPGVLTATCIGIIALLAGAHQRLRS